MRIALLGLFGLLTACGGEEPGPTVPAKPSAPLFRDITEASGVSFAHDVSRTDNFPLPEIMGAGCAVFDANGDGLLDIYFTNCGTCGGAGAKNRLFLRQADGSYRDDTDASGLGDTGYGMGVATGDIDNDGDLDVYVGNDGPDALYVNDGSGKFSRADAGITAEPWTTSVAFVDYDGDGWLDIFVTHYVAWDPTRVCTNARSRQDYCTPKAFPGVSDRVYRNLGNGKFEDTSAKTGVAAVKSNGLGVIVDDFDDDGWPDIFVANDGEANHLWTNMKDGTFREDAMMTGVAVNAAGAAEASMGVASGDVDSDGDVDLFMTHLLNETNTLYLREGGTFVDGSMRSGLGSPSRRFTGFGTAMFDIELDGDLDLLIANGRVEEGEPYANAKGDAVWRRYAEPNQVFLGDGKGSFTDVSETASVFCGPSEVGRGLAVADLDADGDLDIVVANCGEPARIYENTASGGHWLQIDARDAARNRHVLGAVVWVKAGGKTSRAVVAPQNSYLSSTTATLHFGLGSATTVDSIEVRWPGGQTEVFPGGPADRRITLLMGEGEAK